MRGRKPNVTEGVDLKELLHNWKGQAIGFYREQVCPFRSNDGFGERSLRVIPEVGIM
jgi:hypothetical protein